MPSPTAKKTSTDTRERILVEAEILFAGQGFHATGMAQIAKRVGIAKSVIYHHFQNKDAILARLIEDFFQAALEVQGQASLEPALLVKDKNAARAEVARVARGLLELLEQRKRTARIILRESIGAGREPLLLEVLERCYQAGFSSGEGDELPALKRDQIRVENFFLSFLPLLNFVVFRDRWCASYSMDPEDVERFFVDAFVRYQLDAYLPWLMEI